MLDESNKKRLRRLWYKRLGISVGLVLALGFSFTKGVSITEAYFKYKSLSSEKDEVNMFVITKRNKFYLLEAVYLNSNQTPYYKAPYNSIQPLVWFIKKRADALQVHETMYRREYMNGLLESLKAHKDINIIEQVKAEQVQKKAGQALMQDVIYLALSVFGLIIMSLLLLRMRNQISLSFTGQLICFIPEEFVAELEALSKQLKSNNYPVWLVQMIIFKCFLRLIFALYIQINIDNFWLPSKKK